MIAILRRWRLGLSIAAALALLGLMAALAHYRHAYHAERSGRRADRAAFVSVQAEADRIARAALAHAEDAYRAKAQDADHAHTLELAHARAAADRFIAAHRVRGKAAGRAPGGTAAVPESDGPGLPAPAPADSVVVAESDVHACTNAVIYARKAHGWAATLSTEN